MFNLTNPEAFKVLMVNYPEAEKLVVDAMEGRLLTKLGGTSARHLRSLIARRGVASHQKSEKFAY